MTTLEKILLSVSLVSIAANGYLLTTYNEEGATTVVASGACDNQYRYNSTTPTKGGGTEIDDTEFNKMTDAWRAYTDTLRYANFSKKGLDSLFAVNQQANTLRIYCGIDAAGNTTMIAAPFVLDTYEIVCGGRPRFIKSDNVCPSVCD